jgi:phage terminase small subunit
MSDIAETRWMSHSISKMPTETVLKGLEPAEAEFCLQYLANGFNATAAYRSAHPTCTSASARQLGSRMLTKVHIRAFLGNELEAHWKAQRMSGDEALGRVALDARADIRLLFDAQGKFLPPQRWPDEIANSIESFELKADGSVKVKLVSKSQARRRILEQAGLLRPQPGDGLSALAQALRHDLSRV